MSRLWWGDCGGTPYCLPECAPLPSVPVSTGTRLRPTRPRQDVRGLTTKRSRARLAPMLPRKGALSTLFHIAPATSGHLFSINSLPATSKGGPHLRGGSRELLPHGGVGLRWSRRVPGNAVTHDRQCLDRMPKSTREIRTDLTGGYGWT